MYLADWPPLGTMRTSQIVFIATKITAKKKIIRDDDVVLARLRAVRCRSVWSRNVITDENAPLVTKLQGYTEGYYQLAHSKLIAGLLPIDVVSPLTGKLMQGSQIN
jgi:hypothetical protein